MKKINLDAAATSKVCDSVIANIQEWVVKYNNPSSANEKSLELRKEIEEVRQKVANFINCDPEEIYFTSGSTESCAIAIDGFLKANSDYVVVSSNIEHPAILENPNIDLFLPCNSRGIVDLNHLKSMDIHNVLCCCMLVNNEIGTIQPVKEISEIMHKSNGVVFSDLTAAVGHIPVDVQDLGVDIACFSGHKIGSLKGIGVLYVRKGIKISGIMYGHQEQGIRPGTYNYLAIKSLGAAIDEINLGHQLEIMNLCDWLFARLWEIDNNIHLNGGLSDRIASNLNFCISDIDIDNQQLVGLLDMNGFIISAGSACSSGLKKPSHVLKAIGLSDDEANHSIRITLGNDITPDDVDAFVNCLGNIIQIYKK